MTPCKIIAVAGGSGSGKTTFARLLVAAAPRYCAILSQDHYYVDQSARFRGDGENVNFDHPDALDFALLARHLADLKGGAAIEVPIYDFVAHIRKRETVRFEPARVILLDGTLILSQAPIRAQVDASVFITCPEALRLERRLRRDMNERGRTREGVLKQFSRQVKPMHDLFVEPSRSHASHVISGNEPFEAGIQDWARLLITSSSKEIS